MPVQRGSYLRGERQQRRPSDTGDGELPVASTITPNHALLCPDEENSCTGTVDTYMVAYIQKYNRTFHRLLNTNGIRTGLRRKFQRSHR